MARLESKQGISILKLFLFLTLIISILLTIFKPIILVDFINLLIQDEFTLKKFLYIETAISSIYFFIYYQKIFLDITPSKEKDNNYLNYKKITNVEINYYREIPLKGNLYQIFWLAINYQMISNKANLIGAFILKWLNESKIQINNNNEIVLPELSASISIDPGEQILINILYEAAGKNKILEINELQKWTRKHKKRINKYFNEIILSYNKIAIESGLIIKKDGIMYETEELRKKALQIAGFKKFILDYSLIKERELSEVKIWENYLIVANILGISKQVRQNLKRIYPDIESSLDENYSYVLENFSFTSIMFMELILFFPISILGAALMGAIFVGAINFFFIIITIPARLIVRWSIKRL